MMVSKASEPQISARPGLSLLAMPSGLGLRAGGGRGARRLLEDRDAALGELGEARTVTLLVVLEHLRAHARLPVAAQVVGDCRRRLRLIRGAGEEFADLVGHLDEQVDVHEAFTSAAAGARTRRAGRRARTPPASV